MNNQEKALKKYWARYTPEERATMNNEFKCQFEHLHSQEVKVRQNLLNALTVYACSEDDKYAVLHPDLKKQITLDLSKAISVYFGVLEVNLYKYDLDEVA